MLQWWRKQREYRERIWRTADELIADHGDAAYDIARQHRRESLRQRDDARHRFWSKVARIIADRTGREVGVDTATRYLGDNA